MPSVRQNHTDAACLLDEVLAQGQQNPLSHSEVTLKKRIPDEDVTHTHTHTHTHTQRNTTQPYKGMKFCHLQLHRWTGRVPGWCSGKESTHQCRRSRRCRFKPQVGKIPQQRKWQLTPVFLPGKFHGQRSLVGYSPWGCKESDMTKHALMHTRMDMEGVMISEIKSERET